MILGDQIFAPNNTLRKKHGTVRANGIRKPPERKRKIKQANPAG